ncbi:hypothetical protein Slin14017_G085510 [Septoria linicola]|nr:hypothetical protein Slin14017_G085510 [Septoria linicola]
MAEKTQQTSTKPTVQGNKNVAGGPLSLFQKGEGFHKDGYCRSSSKEDSGPRGNFSIAATLTHGFLQSEYGDDPPYKGHSAGQKMCISAHDFLSAIKEMGPDTGPKVHLHATDERALEVVDYKTLKKYAAAPEAGAGSGRQEGHVDPKSSGGAVKESSEVGGDQGAGSGKSQNKGTEAKPKGSGGQRG